MTQNLVGALFATLGLDTAVWDEGVERARSGLGSVGAKFQAIGATIASVGAAAVAAGGAALVGFGANALTMADDVGDAAARIGVSAEDFQKLSAAATAAGAAPGLMTEALDKLNARLGAFRQSGSGEGAEAFKTLGLEAKIASGEIQTADQAFYAAARGLEGIEDPALKARLSMQLFGRAAGTDMLEVLAPGEAALRSFGDAAAASGRVMSDEMVAKLAHAKLRLDETKLAASQVATVFAGELIVGFSGVLDKAQPLIQSVIGLAEQVGAYLGPKLGELGASMTALATGPMGQTLGPALGAVANLLGKTIVFAAGLAVDAITGMITITDRVWRLPGEFMRAGQAVLDGFANGLRSRLEGVRNTISKIGDDVAQWFRDRLGIRSPSLVFFKIGEQIAEGLRLGLQSGSEDVAQGTQALFSSLMTGSERATVQMLADLKTLADARASNLISLKAYNEAAARVMARAARQQATDATVPFADASQQVRRLVETTQEGAALGLQNAMSQADWQETLRYNFSRSFTDGIRSALSGDFGDFIKGRLQQFASRMFDRAFENLGGALFDAMGRSGGSSGGFWGSVLKFGKNLLGFQTGGSFTVGGSGGPDSKIVSFRATPGEMVDIRKPGQAAGGQTVVHVYASGAIERAEIVQMIERGMGGAVQVARAATPADLSQMRRRAR